MVFPALGSIGALAGGVGSLAGGLFGGSQQPAVDYASLAALQLAPGNVVNSTLAQQSSAQLGAYLAALNTETGLRSALSLGQFNQGAFANEKAISTYAALMQGLGAAGVGSLANKDTARTQIQAMGPATKAGLADTYSKTAAGLSASTLSEEGKALNNLSLGIGSQADKAASVRNKYVSDMGDTANYKIRSEIDTQKGLNLMRGQTEADLAKKRWGAGMAMSAATGWA